MTILERDLEDIIWGNIENKDFDKLAEHGIYLDENYQYHRQPCVTNGRLDILGINHSYKEGDGWIKVGLNVIELKKDKLDSNAFAQAISYAYQIMEDIRELVHIDHEIKVNVDFDLKITLIGNDISDGLQKVCLLWDCVDFYTYEVVQDEKCMGWRLKFYNADQVESPITGYGECNGVIYWKLIKLCEKLKKK